MAILESSQNLIKALHENMKVRVGLNGELSDPFAVSNGVKQFFVFFFIFFTATLTHAFKNCNKEDSIQRRPNTALFNFNQFKSTHKLENWCSQTTQVSFLTAWTPRNLKNLKNCPEVFRWSKVFGPKINIKKNETMYQPVSRFNTKGLNIKINNQDPNRVSHFKYWGVKRVRHKQARCQTHLLLLGGSWASVEQ